jgi:hypothetical protein
MRLVAGGSRAAFPFATFTGLILWHATADADYSNQWFRSDWSAPRESSSMIALIRAFALFTCFAAAATVASASAPALARQVSVGSGHACAVTTAGAALCWGNNQSGQLGDGTTTNRATPTPVLGLEAHVTAIAAGGQHTCATTDEGSVWCWRDGLRPCRRACRRASLKAVID